MADQKYNQTATDSLLNFETVKYFNAEKHEEDRFEKALVAYKAQNVIVSKSLVVLNIAQSFIISIGMLVMLVLASYFVDIGEFTVGTFVMFNQYNMQVYSQLNFLGSIWRWIRQAMVDVEQVLNLLEHNERIEEVEDPVFADIRRGEIEFRNVSFTYDTKLKPEEQTTIIENLSFKIPAGHKVGIVGQTGSGKSTIMRLLYRFYDVSGGQILIDGQDISKMKLSELRSHIAIVP